MAVVMRNAGVLGRYRWDIDGAAQDGNYGVSTDDIIFFDSPRDEAAKVPQQVLRKSKGNYVGAGSTRIPA